jgi:transposase
MDLLMLPGWRAVGHEPAMDGSLIVKVELLAPKVPACTCDAPRVLKHGTRRIHFRDNPINRQPVKLRITRQRYRCQACGTILLDDLPGMDSDRQMTVRFRKGIAEDAVRRTFTDTAHINGVRESLVRRVFAEYATKQLEGYRPRLPRVLGMDEKVISGKPRFVIGDVEARTMLDMTASRQHVDLKEYFHAMAGERQNVEVITQDMYWPYKNLNELYFRQAVIVIDKFHVVRYANLAVEAVRKKIQAGLDNDGRISLKRKLRLLAARTANLDDQGRLALKRVLADHPALDMAVQLKELFYDIYEAQSPAEAEKHFETWKTMVPPEMTKPFSACLSFMQNRRWRRLILNYFEHPYTNAYVEALNGLIDQINRSGRGYNLDVLRAKALLRYGEVKRIFPSYTREYREAMKHVDLDAIAVHMGHGIDLSTFERDAARAAFW